MYKEKILAVVENIERIQVLISVLDDDYKCLIATSVDDANVLLEANEPEVIILSFSSIELSQSAYFDILKNKKVAKNVKHEAVLLCERNEVNKAYSLCKNNIIYDYIINDPKYDLIHINLIIKKIHGYINSNTETFQTRLFAKEASNLESLSLDIQNVVTKADKAKAIANQAVLDLSGKVNNDLFEMSERIKNRISHITGGDELSGLINEEVKSFSINALGNSINDSQNKIDTIASRWGKELREIQDKHQPRLDKLSKMSKSTKKMILVVEDNEVYGELINQIISSTEKYDTNIKTSVHQGLTSMVCDRPDMVFLDYELPDATAVEFLIKASEISTIQHIPVVMLTNHSSRDIVNSALTLGAVDYVVKPASKKIIIEKILKWIDS
jgi:DNA-binding NtrC family response regulator